MSHPDTPDVDVLIVGAGLSGIGAAAHLRDKCPDRSFAILESRGAIGGTWDLFRYPGIRSDSDMFTLGYSFAPWKDSTAIADGTSIREYVRTTAAQRGITERIRFHHKVIGAEWSTEAARWTVRAQRTDTDETVTITCGFLFVNSGYYRYDQGFSPTFPGQDDFAGTIVHPQHWPQDLDYAGKRVVIIGSGATAVTLGPAMAETAEHVTMLQRSPSYVVALPGNDALGEKLRKWLPDKLSYSIVRWKHVLATTLFYQLSRARPELMKKILAKGVRSQVPAGFDAAKHFTPSYEPWDQRMCIVPDGDLFRAVRRGGLDIATDTIETFTEHGIRLSSGEELAADVIVTATGLNLQPIGGMTLAVDGQPIELGKTMAYKGMMLSGVPNFALTIGYTNASWTLKADLVAGYVCRLLNHMSRNGYGYCTPTAPPGELPTRPLIDLQSGYVRRSIDQLPKQGPEAPWRLYQNYPRDLLLMRHGSLEDGAMRFSRVAAPARKESVA
ncbi:MAG TPA: NAD(P)/FAD-dependent oxidoreductase [Pseudonocardiaceae bacterium]|jgi:cation diffusion facilitator CzcD-associated flavoprotein CzcO|nr:NAD(P)/FAD-dependent oxidoreductase [Pseudonocardiaceae bacterium]